MNRALRTMIAFFLVWCLAVPAWADSIEEDTPASGPPPKVLLDGETAGPDDGQDWSVQSPASDYYDDMGQVGSAPATSAPSAPPPPPARKETDEFGQPVQRW